MLEFNEERHEYLWNGKKVPGVSEILRTVGLTKDYSGVSPFYRERGQALHLAVKYYLKGTLDESSIDPIVQPYYDGFRRFWDKKRNPKILYIEEPMYSEEAKFAGTPDLILENCIIDWKCSKSHDRVAQLQGEAYKVLYGGPIPFDVVQLAGDGNFEVFEYGPKVQYWDSIMKIFSWKTKRKD
jgi:hypothetical protein